MREGDEGLVPQARPAQGDHTTGLAFAAGILAALRQASALARDKPLKPRYLKLQCGRKHPTMRPPLLMKHPCVAALGTKC